MQGLNCKTHLAHVAYPAGCALAASKLTRLYQLAHLQRKNELHGLKDILVRESDKQSRETADLRVHVDSGLAQIQDTVEREVSDLQPPSPASLLPSISIFHGLMSHDSHESQSHILPPSVIPPRTGRAESESLRSEFRYAYVVLGMFWADQIRFGPDFFLVQ